MNEKVSGNSNVKEEEAPATAKYAASKDPIELRIHMHFNDREAFDDNWEAFKKAAEFTNVTLKGVAPKSASKSVEVFNLMMSSGDIPDIVQGERDPLEKFGKQGAFVPLNDLIDQHAPNIKKFLDSRLDVKRAITAGDGNIYFIPFIPEGDVAEGWFYRQDWLDKLKLQAPKTIDEFYNVMKAFKEKDPNGNGKADEVPIFDRNNANWMDHYLVLWDARRSMVIRDGNVGYGPLEPQFKTAVSSLAKWYKEGLIDKEIFTRGNKSRDIMLGDNVGGMTQDWFASTYKMNQAMKDKVPGLSLQAYAPPAGMDGKIREATRRDVIAGYGWSISSSSKYQEEAIKYFDFWFTEEGNRLNNFGIEGITYDMVDGAPKLRPEMLQGTLPDNLLKHGAFTQTFGLQEFDQELQNISPEAQKVMNEYRENKYSVELPPILKQENVDPKLLDEKTQRYQYVAEKLQKWILGAENIEDNYDEFVAQLKKMNIEEALKADQAAYEKYISVK
ncbi:hypothetical protein SY83_16840 [Paenibacillus swuensis]|uniref:ABC transporter substrate-binding protein n=1 Tax=Paenibacillus swuensis TaxID=1178515 RepID=A0A172TQD9_9BACL|nr:hypothetical protein SY83_16840 [Paenibacillus swuensis]